ncbi:MAG: 16S rRNA (adenine(1518)-N(6)/adenine(1519)-N(6))-dimethyltransferase RsmA [Clostridiales bacterium]|nr:16S rRNA (adenine(1518)-N(6)/adenine(1519)-N(6))-dimethyltransferase RsmA [Clostridiales bacterium]
MKLYAPSTIREIRDRFGFRFSKSLGQNFLTDKNIIDQILEGSGITGDDLVIEIGPGIGVITREAAQVAHKVIAIEIDTNLIPILNWTLGDLENVEIVNQDVLKTQLNDLIAKESFPGVVRVVGNLPYYITTPIIMKLLEDQVPAASITVMMQKEVADRLTAKPGTKDFGAISLMVEYFAEAKEIVKVPRTVFVPQPKVDSTVLRLDIRDEKPVKVEDEEFLFKVIKAGFGQRRKTLSNALSVLKGYDKATILRCLEEAGIDPVRRGETLSLEEYARLSDVLRSAI